jgi:hypothetical protein
MKTISIDGTILPSSNYAARGCLTVMNALLCIHARWQATTLNKSTWASMNRIIELLKENC